MVQDIRRLDQGAVGANFEGPTAVRPGRSGGGACPSQGKRQESLGKGTSRGEIVGALAMAQGAKLAHRWTARSGTKPQLAEVIDEQEHICTPVEMMVSLFKTWVAKWQKAQDFTQDTVAAIQDVRAYAKAKQDLPKIELKDLDEALATMNDNRVGSRPIWARFTKSLPKDGSQMFVDLLNECEEQIAWPWQVYITLVRLLAKEVKGERPTSLLTMLLESHEETWCSRVVRRKSGLLGRCIERSLPLQAALRRLVADELTQHTDSQEACTVLFGVESFYDSVSLSLVARAGLKLAYSLFYWARLCSHMQGVRFLTAGCSGFSEGIVISNGAAAGWAQGNHAARLVLHDILEKSISSGSGIFLEHNHRIRPENGKVWATNATAMMTRSPATCWRYVRGHMSAVIVTLMQHKWTPFDTHPRKTRKATDGL